MRTRGVRIASLILGILAVFVALGMSSAGAADGDKTLLIRKADTTDPKSIKFDFVWTGGADELKGLKINQNGADIAPSGAPSQLKVDKAVVFVIDSGPGMDKDGALVNARQGAVNTINAMPEGTQFSVVQAGDKADLKLALTSDKADAVTAVNAVGATKGSAVWSALRIAGGVLEDSPQVQPNIVLIVGDDDNVNAKDQPVGSSAVTGAGATVWAVERLGQMDPSPYNALVGQAGGQVLATDVPTKMGELTSQAGTTIQSQQYQVAYDSGKKAGEPAEVKMTVGDKTDTVSFILGGVYQGSQALRPVVESRPGTAGIFSSTAVLVVALLLTLVGVALFAYAITSLFVKDDLSNVLQPYADPYGADDDEQASALGKSALIARAVSITEQVAENQGYLSRAEGALERANLPLRGGEALFIYVVIVVVVTAVGLFFTRNMIGGIIFGVLGAMVPVMSVNYMASKRRKTFMSQLPDTLSLLSGTLKAGYSLMQGVEAVSQEVSDPMGIELRRVVTEARLGRPLEESLDASAERMDSPDFAWAVMAIRIQREVGGNLSELLMTVADTMVARERLRRDVAALTAEGRVSAVVLACLPIGLGVIMFVLNPEYTSVLFNDGLGIAMLVTAIFSMLIGFFWMKKIINIEI